jgi:hypothetical protein
MTLVSENETPFYGSSTNSKKVSGIATPNVSTSCPTLEEPTVKLTGDSTTQSSSNSTTNNTTNSSQFTSTSSSSTPSSSTSSSSSTPATTSTSYFMSSPAVSQDFSDIVKAIFNATTLTILFWLMTIYVIYRLALSIFGPKSPEAVSSGQLGYSRTIDLTLGIIFILALFGSYYSLPKSEQSNLFGYTIEWTYQFFNNPWSLLILIWFTIIFFLLVWLLRVPTAPDVKPVLVGFVEGHIWVFYMIFAVIFFFKYILNINIVTILLNNPFMIYLQDAGSAPSSSPSFWSSMDAGVTQSWDNIIGIPTPTAASPPSSSDIDYMLGTPSAQSSSPGASPGSSSYTPSSYTPSSGPSSSGPSSSGPSSGGSSQKKQVYNISQNKYCYQEAQEVCQALDASLATYDQIAEAYNQGAEWCTYGWSADQMAFFPTQKSTYDRLAQNPNTKHACGRPGINGGYMANPALRFGVNCYGVKPAEPQGWEPPVINAPMPAPSCEPPENPKMAKLRKGAKIAGFNNIEWSEY